MNNLKTFEEISSDYFKKHIDSSMNRKTDKRTEKMGTLFFHKFIGSELFGGEITNIVIDAPSEYTYIGKLVSIHIKYHDKNNIYHDDYGRYPKSDYLYYDINKDFYFDKNNNKEIEFEISRKDAVLLSKISLHINPDSKYKQTGKFFNIKNTKY